MISTPPKQAFNHLPWHLSEMFYPDQITLPNGIISTHEHLRDEAALGDGRSELYTPYASRTYRHLIAIGNTADPLTTPAKALMKRQVWSGLKDFSATCMIHVAGLVNEKTTPEEFIHGYDLPLGQRSWQCMKMFLRAASNAHGADVDDVKKVLPLIKAMATTKWQYAGEKKPVLKIHCERKFTTLGRRIAVESRERAAVERDVEFILREVPTATIEICHVSDGDTVEAIRYYQKLGYEVHGEISPHYGWTCVDDLFENGQGGTGFNNHLFCLPVFKSRKDMKIINEAMTSGDFHYGPDAACWADAQGKDGGVKIPKSGVTVGGQTQHPDATISKVIETFIENRSPAHKLRAYLHDNAAELYGIEPLEVPVTYEKTDWVVPDRIDHVLPNGETLSCVVAMGGQTRLYQRKERT